MPKINLNNPESASAKKVPPAPGAFKRLLDTEITFGSKKLNAKSRQEIYQILFTLLDSGLDIMSAFDLLIYQTKKKNILSLLNIIKENVSSGLSLANAFEATGQFSPYEVISLRIGEETGKLPQVLNELSVFFEKRIEQRKKMISIFSYPIMVLLTAVAAVLFMMKYVIPMFEDVFRRFQGELPALTRAVIAASHKVGTIFLILFFLVAVIIILHRSFRRQDWYRAFTSALFAKIPFFGLLNRQFYLSRFCMSMELLISSRIPLVTALELARSMVNYYPIEAALGEMIGKIRAGSQLYKCMEHHAVFDKKMTAMIRVGEEVNQLAPMFAKLKSNYDTEIAFKSGIMGTVLEPFIIIFVGAFVGLILVSMYMPMFKMGTAFGG